MYGNSSKRLLMAMSVFALATTGIASSYLPESNIPSVEAFDSMGSAQVQNIDYYKTEQGFKLVLTNSNFKAISEGVTLQTYFGNNFGVMLDQVPVDTTSLIEQYGFDYSVELSFVFKEQGFDLHVYAINSVAKERIEIDSSVGLVVQVPQNLFLKGEDIQLMHGTGRTDQLNDDGIIYAVLYDTGSYQMERTSGSVEDMTSSEGGLYAVVDNSQETVQSQPTEEQTEESSIIIDEANDEGRVEEVEVDSTEVVTAIEDNTSQDFKVKTEQNIPKKAPVEQVNTRAVETASTLLEQGKIVSIAEDITNTKEGIAPSFGIEEPVVASAQSEAHEVKDEESAYQPDTEVTRGSFAVLLSQALGLEGVVGKYFEDIDDKTTESAINAVYEKGYMSGATDKTFAPKVNITKQQGAVVLGRILEEHNLTKGIQLDADFNGLEKVADYAKESVVALKSLNILEGGEKEFNPHTYLTKHQTHSMISNTLDLLPNSNFA